MIALLRGGMAGVSQYDYPVTPDKFVIIGHKIHDMAHLPRSFHDTSFLHVEQETLPTYLQGEFRGIHPGLSEWV